MPSKIAGNSESNSSNSSKSPNLPIALRKGVRSCTKYPLSNFVSYAKLSPSHLTFISQLSSVAIPKTVQEALSVPEWKR